MPQAFASEVLSSEALATPGLDSVSWAHRKTYGNRRCAWSQAQLCYAFEGMSRAVGVVIVSLAACLAGCAARTPAAAPVRAPRVLETREGFASYYGREFQGRMTASGSRFDMNAMVAAHPTYPFGTLLRVTNIANGRATNVRIVDRGPASDIRAGGVVIDLSRRAAEALGFLQEGRTRVRLEVLAWGAR